MRAVVLVRVVAGLVFLGFGVGKFSSHSDEVRSFDRYGLPEPDAFVYAIGVVEVVGGALLVLGVATAPAALVLAGDMLGATVVSGILQGEAISLTLAPALLAAMVLLLLSSDYFPRRGRSQRLEPTNRRLRWRSRKSGG